MAMLSFSVSCTAYRICASISFKVPGLKRSSATGFSLNSADAPSKSSCRLAIGPFGDEFIPSAEVPEVLLWGCTKEEYLQLVQVHLLLRYLVGV